MKQMKKITIIIAVAIGYCFLFTACSDYLDAEHYFKDRQDLESVFESKDYSDQWLAGVYSHLAGANADVASKGFTPFNFISDDMFYGDRDNSYRKYKNGEYDEGWNQDSWGSCYEGIRDASTYIHNIDMNKEMNHDEITDRKSQARFLRAYYYWLLLRKYGPIPILPDEGLDYTAEYEDLATPRNTYTECADFITSQLALAAQGLPLTRSNRDIARPTRGAALAARAKVYLFAASPLFNGNTDAWASGLVDKEGKRLLLEVYDEELWAKAAAAAKDVIDLNVYYLYTAPFRAIAQGGSKPATIVPPYNAAYSERDFPEGWQDIDPFESYRQIFNGDIQAYSNPELIFSRVQNQGGDNENVAAMVLHQVPFSLKGWNTHGMTLKMFDTYYMNDGSNFQTESRISGFTNNDTDYMPLSSGVSLQNANREPRFYASVAYSGSIWENESATRVEERYQKIMYYRGTPDGKQATSPAFHIRTGIGIKKYYNPLDSYLEGGRIVSKPEPAIRYAEVLLTYAEAMNELTGSYTIPAWNGEGSIVVGRNTEEMSKSVTQIRVRAGLPDFDSDTYADANKFRIALKRERQIELFAEGHRYFDLRRWKDAPNEEAEIVRGFNMNMESSQRDLFYIPIDIPSMPTVFVDKMNLWPISHSELKRNRKLTQNPGWTYFD